MTGGPVAPTKRTGRPRTRRPREMTCLTCGARFSRTLADREPDRRACSRPCQYELLRAWTQSEPGRAQRSDQVRRGWDSRWTAMTLMWGLVAREYRWDRRIDG